MKHKAAPVEFKAEGEPGFFSALVSVFGNVDSVGDRVMPGAFKKTLASWRSSGDPLPIVFNHDWGSPDAHIGVADPRAVVETEKGLLVQGKLDIEDNPVAKQVYKLLKRRSLKSFSFGYTVPDGGEKFADDGANELLEIDLVEAGPTLRGANDQALLQSVKSALDEAQPEVAIYENKASRNVGPGARAHLRNLIEFYMKKPHPFTACVRDNTKRFGPEGAKRVCATLKDIGMGTTHWREGGSSNEPEVKAEERDFEQELYDAAEGNFEGLMEMWHEHANGEKAEEPQVKVAITDSTIPVTTETNTAVVGAPESAEVEEGEEAEVPVADDALEKAIQESDHFSDLVAAEVDRRLEELAKAAPPPEPKREPIEDLLEQEVITEVEKPESPPVKPAAKADPLKDEIDRLRLEIAAG